MNAYLKVKIKSLAAEATIIHREERVHNIGARGRTRLKRQLRRMNDLTEAQRTRIERRLQAPTPTAMATFWGLRQHRTQDVRSESRSAQIAYGYLRGRTYQQIEGAAKSEPDWKRVQRLIEKYGPKGQTDLEAKLQAWREAV